MRLSEISKRNMAMIYAVLILITGGLLYSLIVAPERERYQIAVDEYNSQRQRELRETNRRDALVEEYLALKEKAAATEKLLFTRRDVDDFYLKKMPDLTRETRNDLSSMMPKPSQPLVPTQQDPNQKNAAPSPLQNILQKSVSTTITGRYGDMIELFKALEQDKKLMAIHDVRITGARDVGGKVSISFLLNLIHTNSDVRTSTSQLDQQLANITSQAQLVKAVNLAEEVRQQTPEGEDRSRLDRLAGLLRDMLPGRPEKVPEPAKRNIEIRPRDSEKIAPKDTTAISYTSKWSVQVDIYSDENLEEAKKFLRSEGHGNWTYKETVKATLPYPLLVGKFNTKRAAEQFGEAMKAQMPWVEKYMIKKTELVEDTILKGTRTEK